MTPRFPHLTDAPFATHEGYTLRGRFVRHLQEERASRFYVYVYSGGEYHFVEMVTKPTRYSVNELDHEIEAELMEEAVFRAKARIDAGSFEEGGSYDTRITVTRG